MMAVALAARSRSSAAVIRRVPRPVRRADEVESFFQRAHRLAVLMALQPDVSHRIEHARIEWRNRERLLRQRERAIKVRPFGCVEPSKIVRGDAGALATAHSAFVLAN